MLFNFAHQILIVYFKLDIHLRLLCVLKELRIIINKFIFYLINQFLRLHSLTTHEHLGMLLEFCCEVFTQVFFVFKN